MDNEDVLLTLAEVAVAFAGFASLVSILGRRYSRDDPRLVASRLRGMLIGSLIVVAFALLPIIPHRYGLGAEATWRLCSALQAAAGAVLVVVFFRDSRALRRAGVKLPGLIVPVVLGIFALAEGLLVLNLFGVFGTRASATYLAGLALYLLLSGMLFFRVLWSFLSAAAMAGAGDDGDPV